MGEWVPKIWTSLEESCRPKFPKTAAVKAQINMLSRIFPKPFEYKVFCEEGVLVQADEVLVAANTSVEPNQVPFSTMCGKEELEADNAKIQEANTKFCEKKRELNAHALEEMHKYDSLKENFTKVEGENFELTSKIKKLQLFLDRATKTGNEAEEKAKVAQETPDAVMAPRVSEGVEAFKRFDEYALEDGNESAYYLCRFAKSYKDVCPAIVDHCQDFIQKYPEDWFSDVDIRAPLFPAEGDEV
ncbi:hypothetical protein LIER_00556 [Lithospermum erythrorhizon]|uniref:Uncharacterized protein n=1 Tax=Lithospermum erythrorhizon TaxID=34254 RepID=A0AAV3NHV4_LITER